MSDRVKALNKDLDILAGYDRKKLSPSQIDILGQQVSIHEAFDVDMKKSQDPFETGRDSASISSIMNRWSRFKNYCLASFQTRASDFSKTEVSVLFSKRVRDRLAELSISSDEAQQITNMQQNEERLKEKIQDYSKQLEEYHKEERYWEMIELISEACKLLSNTQSPQFYPAQFMMILDLVESFGKMVFNRISQHPTTKGDFLKDKQGSSQLLCLNWSMILCRTSQLLPRLLLQTSFLRCVKFHPFKSIEQSISQIVSGISGLGSATSGIYARAYLLHIVFTTYPNISPEFMMPMFISYVKLLSHLKNGSFKRQFNIIDYSFNKYIETHRPALRFFISIMTTHADATFLKNALNEFYSLGNPSSFIMSVFLEELTSDFVSQIFPVLILLIDNSDDVVPKPELIHRLVTNITEAKKVNNVLDVMNEIWARMKEFPDNEDFVYVAAPLTKFIAKFCSPHYINLFLTNVATILKNNFASRQRSNPGSSISGRELTKRLTTSVQGAIFASVDAGKSFHEVLTHVPSVVTLMDFLDEAALVEVSRYILNDVSKKPFELNDPLSVRILLELSQILFQSLSVLSPVDIVEKTNNTIEWFLYRVDFHNSIEAHLNFLLSARSAFPTSGRLLSVIVRIALRLCSNAFTKKLGQIDVITRSLLAFAFVTIPSIPTVIDRASLYLLEANVALSCCVSCFAHSCFEEFLNSVKGSGPSKELFSLFEQALSLLLVLPAKPGVDPFESVRSLIKAAVNTNWTEDESMVFAMDSIILCSHMLRSEFVLKVANLDSNDVLFAGSEEYQERGLSVINQMIPKLIESLKAFKNKGVVNAKTKVPTLALRCISNFADSLISDKALIQKFIELADLAKDGTSIQQLKEQTGQHLEKVYHSNELGQKFIAKYFSE